MSLARRVILIGGVLLVSGCDPVNRMKTLLGLATPPPTTLPVTEKKDFDFAKANREILAEMIRVVFDTNEVADDEFFQGLLSSFNQGASIEGIYRGLIQGQRYRALESGSLGAGPAQIRFLATELARIQEAMREPTRLDTPQSRALPSIEFPEDEAGVESLAPEQDRPRDSAGPRKKGEIENDLMRNFIGASPYTLKRILGDEVLRKLDEMKKAPADRAQWYAGTVLHLRERGVDFGLPLRNSSDFGLHLRFAETVSADRVIWEVLNRYHRVINFLGKK